MGPSSPPARTAVTPALPNGVPHDTSRQRRPPYRAARQEPGRIRSGRQPGAGHRPRPSRAGLGPFDGSAGPGLLIDFNFDHPAAKVVGTGVFVVIDPTVPLYLQLIEPDPDFPAFQRCPRLATG